MRRIVVAALCLVLTLLPCHSQAQRKTQRQNSSEQVIKRLERELEAALLKGDRRALDRLLTHDYLEINAQGGIATKADLLTLARARSSRPPVPTVGPQKTVDDLSIRLHGDSAVVVGRTTIRYQFMDYQTSPGATDPQSPVTVDQERFMRIYAKVGGRWQLVAWQTTGVAKR